MKKKTMAAALALMMAPGFALACSSHETHAMSCPQGETYDAGTRSCVPSPTG